MAPDDSVMACERRIAAVMADAGMSYWLRDALRAAVARDPVDAVDDAELLLVLLQPWAAAIVDEAMALAVEPLLPLDPHTA